ncbi:hypothetical protein CNE_2c14550 [Cupriavidus necator N-1]|jgi:hypothetical protein|uniref:DUF2474 domain-containing protein n=1 Tax=Cupriavidus necator (strain ATCC 43291 / DSM 13513 / CCUG 52238 / LMG 8453 / N-1) TaxID=1042878 RepID=F8GNW9_CUPNN|nr:MULTISPECIES: DUF2474 family protein [Cupriavidus]AEI80418.1 hypothetical protein CNE_2c14550 [Cupriavidus necator N-1]MDX6009955.1 DUF2474 family protein [Cupriavidus necator]QUN30639.1 DUF2474 family protein [Cupriavidus sp. KK10]
MTRILHSRLAARLGWLLALWLAGVGTVFVCASLMKLLMRAAGLAN